MLSLIKTTIALRGSISMACAKIDVEAICKHYGIHPLIAEDILSMNQRPKMDEVEGVLYCLLNMLYYNEQKKQ